MIMTKWRSLQLDAKHWPFSSNDQRNEESFLQIDKNFLEISKFEEILQFEHPQVKY